MMDPRVLSILRPVNLLPVQLPPIDQFTVNNLMNIKPYVVGQNGQASEEYDFIEEYEKKYQNTGSAVGDCELVIKDRKERLFVAQEKIREGAEMNRKIEMERMDQEVARRLDMEDRQRAKEEKDRVERQESLIVSLMQQVNVEYSQARDMLVKYNWNMAQILASKKEEDRRSNAIFELMQALPNLEYEQAKSLLAQNNWNIQQAIASSKGAPFTLNLVIIGGQPYPNNNPHEQLKCDFNRESEAMEMIEYLKKARPLPPGQPLFYKVYRDPACTPQSQISYIELTNTFKGLNMQTNATYYFKKDSVDPFSFQ